MIVKAKTAIYKILNITSNWQRIYMSVISGNPQNEWGGTGHNRHF